jgi:hypothetical protein
MRPEAFTFSQKELQRVSVLSTGIKGDFFFSPRLPSKYTPELFPNKINYLLPRRGALTNFFNLGNIRFVSWGIQWNGKDLAMFRSITLSIRRAPHTHNRAAISLRFTTH